MLEIRALTAHYGAAPVLRGVDLRIAPGEIVGVLGRNGAGRSTLAKAIMGLVARSGSVRWQNHELTGLAPHAIARLGVGYVPETRDVFPGLSVEDNLRLGRRSPRDSAGWTIEQAFDHFGELAARRRTPAGALSGGEQQMLSLCRALMAAPRLLVVDEPAEGLAPRRVARVGQILQMLRAQGTAVLLIEQKLTLALDCAQRVAVMGRGAIVFDGTPAALLADADVRRTWLEVADAISQETA